ncbi:MAG: apolipoprotein N-acyltransferase [Desertifilum sp.]|nr:apolipoprotein N-acyltransferase [Desertifilum sp.]
MRSFLKNLAFSPLAFVVSFASGLGMGLTSAPVYAYFLGWIALIPLWVLICQPGVSFKRALGLAIAWGAAYHGFALSWITGVHPMTWMGVPWLASLAIALFCWFFITLWGTLIVLSWVIGMRLYSNFMQPTTGLARCSRVLFGLTLWCALEAFWALGSLYWTTLAFTQSPYNLAILHLGQLSGATTISAAIAAVNGLIAEWLLAQATPAKPRPLFLALPIGLCLSLHLIGASLLQAPLNPTPETALRVGIIQGNIPNTIKLFPEGLRKAIEGYTAGYETLVAQGVDAVLTPETALPFIWNEQNRRYSSFQQAILRENTVAWLGTFSTQGSRLTNSLLTITGDGEIYSRYDKVKLVPLGEYIPFEDILGQLINRLSPLDAHLAPGSSEQIFDTPFGRAIVGICYDSAFGNHFRRQTAAGGEFIITASNNAHYSATMPAQHHAQDVMRAIESDRWIVRATNTGYSGIVDPHGRTIWISGLNTYETHADTIYRRQTQTLYVRWGDWLLLVLMGLSGLSIIQQKLT